MIIETAAPEHLQDHLPTIYSGWVFRSDETQEMQIGRLRQPGDDLRRSGDGRQFNTVMGSEGNSCASCHTPEDFEMVRATYPRWDEDTGEVQTVEMQVIECQTDRMGMEEPFGYNSQEMRNMTALIASVGRGHAGERRHRRPCAVDLGAGPGDLLHPLRSAGTQLRQLPRRQLRQLIRADHLSQGQINGFPTYRLKHANLDLGPQPLPRLHPRHAGRDLLDRQPRVRGARALRRFARQRPDGRRSGGPQLKTMARPGVRMCRGVCA
jgi:sulfur-oxidizing protein SoxA